MNETHDDETDMNREIFEERLHDLVRNRLDATARREMEAWLIAHPDDRAELERARALVKATADLPRRVEPERDLWPDIRAGIAAGGVSPAVSAGSTARWTGWPAWAGIAAALVALVGGIWTTRQLSGGGDSAGVTADAGPPALSPGGASLQPAAGVLPDGAVDIELAAAEEAFVQATRQLMDVLDARRDRIPPAKLDFVENNLKTINDAINDLRGALRSDPGNPVHGHALAAMYRKKMQLLWMASRLSEES